MILEWFFLLLLLICASVLILKSIHVSARLKLVIISVWIAVVATAQIWNHHLSLLAIEKRKIADVVPREGRPDGYVSSTKCQACHPGQYATWHQTFHRTMTQFASSQTVKGNFDNQDLELDRELFHLTREDGQFYVDMVEPVWRENERRAASKLSGFGRNLANGPRQKMRVGLLTGSHHMQVYWLATGRGNMQMVFPFAWLIDEKRWMPFDQTFLRDPAMPAQTAIWNYTCIRCHATGGQPRDDAEAGTYDSRVGELGIACEACHGPAQDHVASNGQPLHRYKLHRVGQGDSSIINPARLSSKRASEVCGQCHGIKWTPDTEELSHTGFRFRPGQELAVTTPIIQPSKPETQPWLREWLPANPRFLPDRFWSDGEVRVSGREFNGLIDSPCYQKGDLSCLSCHSLHKSNPDDQLGSGMDGNAACLQCHHQFEGKVQEHTRHSLKSSGSLCYNCHMPHTTYGLLKNIRSHRISSPQISSTVTTGRPNACNLCHLDRTLQWTADYLSLWYKQPKPALEQENKTTSASVLLALKGDAGQRALMAWHMGWDPAKKISGEDWLAPYLAQLLVDPYAAVRYVAARSARSLPESRDVELNFQTAMDSSRLSLMKAWSAGPGSRFERSRPELLIGGPAQIELERFNQLLQKRDNHSMDLQE